ncbi:hypothetical protein BGZ63DRAFT_403264 [Mariannaea sp. PMI_226]|nr:hypothetical protein BGZ63DRAFT_403264 [Mariannaea sp. PMI_226]
MPVPSRLNNNAGVHFLRFLPLSAGKALSSARSVQAPDFVHPAAATMASLVGGQSPACISSPMSERSRYIDSHRLSQSSPSSSSSRLSCWQTYALSRPPHVVFPLCQFPSWAHKYAVAWLSKPVYDVVTIMAPIGLYLPTAFTPTKSLSYLPMSQSLETLLYIHHQRPFDSGSAIPQGIKRRPNTRGNSETSARLWGTSSSLFSSFQHGPLQPAATFSNDVTLLKALWLPVAIAMIISQPRGHAQPTLSIVSHAARHPTNSLSSV